MAEITATLVKELREQSGVGMMECKRALVETGGDKDLAMKNLRERGLALAGKRAGRSANEGVLAAEVFNGGKSGAMVEVNCETDFVARNENFQAFVQEVLQTAKETDGDLAEAVKDRVVEKITEIGENILIGRSHRLDVEGNGLIASYIHLGGKVGVLVEVGCEKDETIAQDTFKEAAKDITLHIAACNPQYLDRSEVPEDLVNSEKEIFAKQAEGKPEQVIDKIVSGKIEKFYSQICLLEQGFVKDPDQSVTDLLAAQSKALDDTLSIRRFARLQIGV